MQRIVKYTDHILVVESRDVDIRRLRERRYYLLDKPSKLYEKRNKNCKPKRERRVNTWLETL